MDWFLSENRFQQETTDEKSYTALCNETAHAIQHISLQAYHIQHVHTHTHMCMYVCTLLTATLTRVLSTSFLRCFWNRVLGSFCSVVMILPESDFLGAPPPERPKGKFPSYNIILYVHKYMYICTSHHHHVTQFVVYFSIVTDTEHTQLFCSVQCVHLLSVYVCTYVPLVNWSHGSPNASHDVSHPHFHFQTAEVEIESKLET